MSNLFGFIKKLSLRNRFTLVITFLLLVLLIISTFVEVTFKTSENDSNLRDNVVDLASLLNSALQNAMQNNDEEGLQAILTESSALEHIEGVFILSRSGEPYMSDGGEVAEAEKDSLISAITAGEDFAFHSSDKEGVGHIATGMLKIKANDSCLDCHDDVQLGDSLGYLGIQRNATKEVEEMSASVWRSIFSSLLMLVLLGLTVNWLISSLITRPIRSIINRLSNQSGVVARSSEKMVSSQAIVSDGASNQASSLEEIASSLEEMSASTSQNSDNAHHVSKLANEARKLVDSGSSSMSKMSESITKIRNSSEETAKIVKTIDEIAFQTNLLALNAAVEAARAGEAGKGFAVVAEEVRNLAQRSAQAARNTAELLNESRENAIGGYKVSEDTIAVLDKIVKSIEEVSSLINDVAEASKQQSNGIDQVNTAVSQLDKVTQDNARISMDSTSVCDQLKDQANDMSQLVQELRDILAGGAQAKAQITSLDRKLLRS